MIIEESGLHFRFREDSFVKKYDDSNFYRNYMNQLPEAKGVDFISMEDGRLVLTEIKNCKGHEADNNWRIFHDNKKVTTSTTSVNTTGRESLDIEVSKKIALTIGGLIGTNTKSAGSSSAEELTKYAEVLVSPAAKAGNKQILVILFLEGDFGCETRRKTTIMMELQRSIKKKLSWLNCVVSVVDSATYQNKIFSVE